MITDSLENLLKTCWSPDEFEKRFGSRHLKQLTIPMLHPFDFEQTLQIKLDVFTVKYPTDEVQLLFRYAFEREEASKDLGVSLPEEKAYLKTIENFQQFNYDSLS